MQISKLLTTRKALVLAVGIACASTFAFTAPAQACSGGGCGYKVYHYKHYYRSYRPCCYRYVKPCNYGCSSCYYNSCNTCTYRCNGCGYGSGYYYGGYYY